MRRFFLLFLLVAGCSCGSDPKTGTSGDAGADASDDGGGDDGAVSLLVDEIGGVLEVSQVPFEATPSTVDERVRDLLLGAFTLPDKLLLALNARKVLDCVGVAA